MRLPLLFTVIALASCAQKSDGTCDRYDIGCERQIVDARFPPDDWIDQGAGFLTDASAQEAYGVDLAFLTNEIAFSDTAGAISWDDGTSSTLTIRDLKPGRSLYQSTTCQGAEVQSISLTATFSSEILQSPADVQGVTQVEFCSQQTPSQRQTLTHLFTRLTLTPYWLSKVTDLAQAQQPDFIVDVVTLELFGDKSATMSVRSGNSSLVVLNGGFQPDS